MKVRTRTAGAAAVVALVGLGVGGVAYADSSATHPAKAASGKTTAATAHKHRLLRHVLHGQLVVRAHHKTVTLDLQRGSVTAVGPSSITVKSVDGEQRQYVVTAATKVTSHRHRIAESTISVGDRVFVTALQDNAGDGAATARAIRGVRTASAGANG